MAGKKILIVDDEDHFTALVKMNLEMMGDFAVYTAQDGAGGIESAGKLRPDLILLDIVMPGMDGFEVLEKLKASEETLAIPVAILSAKADTAFRDRTIKLGAEDYIVKPIDMPDLKAKIEEILERVGK